METLEQIKTLTEELSVDVTKFSKGNKSVFGKIVSDDFSFMRSTSMLMMQGYQHFTRSELSDPKCKFA